MRDFFLIALMVAAAAMGQPAILKSPNGGLEIRLETVSSNQTAPSGSLVYSVMFARKPVFEYSALRLELAGQRPLGGNVRIVNSSASATDETYKLLTGKRGVARNHFNALRVEAEDVEAEPASGIRRKLVIEARAYDDGVAFRYVVPEQTGINSFKLAQEGTEFRVVKDATTYALVLPGFRSMYESEFLKLPISAFSNHGGVASTNLIGLPLLMELPGVAWVAIAEADLRDYAAMYLVNPSSSWAGHSFESRLAPQVEAPEMAVTGSLPHHSAWRVLMVASDPGRFIESTILTSLNPEPEIKDPSWIHAGKAAWDWWGGSIGSDGRPAFNTETMKSYVDFAARSRFEYMLIDAGWSSRDDITQMNGKVDVPEVVKYTEPKKVKVWIWAHYGAVNRQMEEAFALYEKWGVAGVKIDFVERDDQEGIAFYYRAAEAAAKHHLMVDFHGCTKPWGLERTWPNVMGYEAVLGMEQSKAGARDNPEHRVMLPFTRMLAGRMDYTPGGFDNVTREEFEPRNVRPMVMGTRAQQLAMYVVYESPFQMVSDFPGAYENQPGFEFIKAVPATWDETRVLNGTPAEYVTIARRSGDKWFVGSMTNWNKRRLEVSLDFLGKGKYVAEIYGDAPDARRAPKRVAGEKKEVERADSLSLELAPGGGWAGIFAPK